MRSEVKGQLLPPVDSGSDAIHDGIFDATPD